MGSTWRQWGRLDTPCSQTLPVISWDAGSNNTGLGGNGDAPVSLISHSHFFPTSWPHPTAGLILTQTRLDCLHLLLGPEELFSTVSVTGGSPDEGPL